MITKIPLNLLVIILILTLLFAAGGVVLSQEIDEKMRNPFGPPEQEEEEVEEPEPVYIEPDIEEIKAATKFILTGIMNSGNRLIAIIDTGQKTVFVENYYQHENVEIISIEEEGILLTYRGKQVYMEIGGEISER